MHTARRNFQACVNEAKGTEHRTKTSSTTEPTTPFFKNLLFLYIQVRVPTANWYHVCVCALLLDFGNLIHSCVKYRD